MEEVGVLQMVRGETSWARGYISVRPLTLYEWKIAYNQCKFPKHKC